MTNPLLAEIGAVSSVSTTPGESSCATVRNRRDEPADDDLLDDMEGDELPPLGHAEHPNTRRERDQVEGPTGEPEDVQTDGLDEPPLPLQGGNRPAFDASVAGDLPVGGFDVVDDDRGLLHGDASGFDRSQEGADEPVDFDDARESDLDPIHVPEDLGDEDELRPSHDDGGAEGTSEDIGAEVDEASLPELDADDGGAFELDDLMRELSRGGFGHESDEDGWALYEGWGARVPCVALAIDGGRVVAAGDELLVIEPGTQAARTSVLPRPATAIAASHEGALVGTDRGVFYAARAQPPASPSALSMLDTELPVRSLAVSAGRTWALVGSQLWQIGSPPAPPLLARSDVLSMASATDALVVLAVGAEPVLERFRGDDGDWETIAVSRDVHRALSIDGSAVVVSPGCKTVAVAWPAGVAISREAGKVSAFLEIENVAGLTFSGAKEAPSLLAVTVSGSVLVVISIDEKSRSRVEGRVDLGPSYDPSRDEPGSISIAWDESREALFVATASGLYALGPRRTH